MFDPSADSNIRPRLTGNLADPHDLRYCTARARRCAKALGGWLDATKDPNDTPDVAIFRALEAASKQLNEERKTGRAKVLEQTALQRTPMATARAALETLAWADLTVYHSWRLTESLRIASAE
jgi:phosphate:Na+ symporter